jgi:8-oxo-dGTP pyrophosphatase MutT (NUDIX family)
MAVAPKENKLHRIAVTGIIWREEGGVRKYLITKRAPTLTAWPGKWCVPGGGMEVDDYVHDAATYANEESLQWYGALEKTLKREIKEETNIEVSDINYLLDIAFIRPDGMPCLVLSMYCAYASGEVVLNEESTEYAWITLAETADYDLIKGIDEEIRLVDERLAKRK